MNYKYNILFICALIISVISCSPDDDSIVSVPEKDRTEQQVVDSIKQAVNTGVTPPSY